MTTSLSNLESSVPTAVGGLDLDSRSPKYTAYRIRHTLPSRFAFLIVCLAIILSTLAYGTVHYWSLAVFFIGAVALLILWVLDSWGLGLVRISRNGLQLPLLGMIVLGLIQLLPLRSPDHAADGMIPLVRSLSFDPYSTRLVIIQLAALFVYFAATLVFVDTPKRLKL